MGKLLVNQIRALQHISKQNLLLLMNIYVKNRKVKTAEADEKINIEAI